MAAELEKTSEDLSTIHDSFNVPIRYGRFRVGKHVIGDPIENLAYKPVLKFNPKTLEDDGTGIPLGTLIPPLALYAVLRDRFGRRLLQQDNNRENR